jgi:hypothetical protein
MRSEVFTVVNEKIVILWDMVLCAVVDGYEKEHTAAVFRGWFLWNVGNHLPGYTVMIEDLSRRESYF